MVDGDLPDPLHLLQRNSLSRHTTFDRFGVWSRTCFFIHATDSHGFPASIHA